MDELNRLCIVFYEVSTLKNRKKYLVIVFCMLSMVVLILDAKTAMIGAKDGIIICLQTVIPSLFPFFFISSVINSYLTGHTITLLKMLGKLCKMPEGSEGLFLIGILGGYPVGARSIHDAYVKGALTKNEAERMLGFCNNVGPAFLFGIGSSLFHSSYVPAVIYLIILLSSILTGMILPGGSIRKCVFSQNVKHNHLHSSIYAIACVCAWVVLYRIVLTFLNRWVLWVLPDTFVMIVSGLLELTNGCIQLVSVDNEGLRFVLLSAFTCLGGFCVANQTITVAESLSCKYYYIGKLMQTGITLLLSLSVSSVLFPGNNRTLFILLPISAILISILIYKEKNNTGNFMMNGV